MKPENTQQREQRLKKEIFRSFIRVCMLIGGVCLLLVYANWQVTMAVVLLLNVVFGWMQDEIEKLKDEKKEQ